jgi:hypothetical protein
MSRFIEFKGTKVCKEKKFEFTPFTMFFDIDELKAITLEEAYNDMTKTKFWILCIITNKMIEGFVYSTEKEAIKAYESLKEKMEICEWHNQEIKKGE